MHRALQLLVLVLVLVLVPQGRAQTFVEGDYQINRKKSTAGFEVAELLAGSNITLTWNDAAKTATITSSTGTGSTSITTLGTITVGTWNATPIADAFIASAATWNAKQAALVSGTNIKTVNNNSLLGSGNLTTAQLGAIADGDTLTAGLTFPNAGGLKVLDTGASNWLAIAVGDEFTDDRTLTFTVNDANRTINLTGDLTVTSAATISGTNTGDQNLSTYIQDGDTLTTGLTFPFGGISMQDEDDPHQIILELNGANSANHSVGININDAQRTLDFSGDLTVSSAATISGTNTGDQTTITGNSGTTTAALGLKTATGTVALSTATAPSSGQVLTATSGTAANWQTPAATGVTSVTGTGTVNGLALTGTVTSTGNLTLGGTLSGVNLATQITGTLPVANGGTGATTLTANNVLLGNGTSAPLEVAPGTNGNVLTSNGTTWTSAAPAASGTKTIAQFTPRDNQPPATAFATLDTRNSIALLDFDTATEEAAIFVGVIPEAAVLTSGITVRITWTAATATSGNCRWGAQWMRCNTDIDSDSFDTATEATTTTSGTSGIPSVTSITCTSIDSLAVGEMYRLKIYRDTTDAADTMTGDAELLTVEARTAN